jgi:signal transduction histidine kinase
MGYRVFGVESAKSGYQGASMQVAYTGPGILKAERKHIFERFYQLPGSSGSVLVLSIIQAIASVHMGMVSLGPQRKRHRTGGQGAVSTAL